MQMYDAVTLDLECAGGRGGAIILDTVLLEVVIDDQMIRIDLPHVRIERSCTKVTS